MFHRWSFARSFLYRGYWLVASMYLVLDVGLSPNELILIGTAQGAASLICEIPAGLVADAISRRWVIVVAQLVIGISMITTGFARSFPALVGTQMLWGIGWTLVSGADIAWITDELNEPTRTDRVLLRRIQWELWGAFIGMGAIAGLGWALGRQFSMISAGVLMTLLGAYVGTRFTESDLAKRSSGRRLHAIGAIARKGFAIARRDRQILMLLFATVLVHGAGEVGRLYPERLTAMGFPAGRTGTLWFGVIGMVTLLGSLMAIAFTNRHTSTGHTLWPLYVGACCAGSASFAMLGLAHSYAVGIAAIFFLDGAMWTFIRSVSVLFVNRQAPSVARATMHSFLAQAEYAGEMVCGAGLSLLATAGAPLAFFGGAVLLLVAGFCAPRDSLK